MNSSHPQSYFSTQATPLLQVLNQTSSSQERISCNGLQKNIHVVVKNAPFTIQLGLTNKFLGNIPIDLKKFGFDAILLYDSPEPDKGVDYVKVKPIDFKPTVSENGDSIMAELRIKVLTSQHENSFFRVKIVALDPATGQQYHAALVTLSEPVKVISKPEQKKKAPTPKKRTAGDMLSETIQRIEEQQKEQTMLIEKLLQSSDQSPSARAFNNNQLEDKENSEFEQAFGNFFRVFNALSSEEKPVKIRKLIRNSTQRDKERISDFLDAFLNQGSQMNTCNGAYQDSLCGCGQCPYKKELERIDEFYKDFLSAPLEQEDNLISFLPSGISSVDC
jgi:hypothetical protein